MKYCQIIDRLIEILSTGKLQYKDTIIVGDNSSGKSDVLRQLIENDKKETFYFIDAVNRCFDVSQILKKPENNVQYSNEINRYRIKEDIFNHKDSFYYNGTPKAPEDLYMNYEDEIKEMMREFLGIQFDIRLGDVGWVVDINEEEADLSSGYQALIRIFLEIVYFVNTKKVGTIVIDEIDEFLSVANSGKIFEFLKFRFPQLNFIVTTHSADLIAYSNQANLILLEGNNFEIVDSGDFSTISQVYDVFETILGRKEKKNQKQEIDEELRRLLNNKIAGVWGKSDEQILEDIKSKEITKAQKLIIRQIEAW